MFSKSIALITAICFMFSSLGVQSQGRKTDEELKRVPEIIRTIVGQASNGWDIVDVQKVEAELVIVSPVVGLEIDLEESNRFAIFQGRNIFNKQIDLPLLRIGIPGFQSAVFLKKKNGELIVCVRYRFGSRIENRIIELKNEDELRRIREYIENFTEIQKNEYTIADSSKISEDEEYPKFIKKRISFEERLVRFPLRKRTLGQVFLKDGDRIKGELLPLHEEESILMETNLDTRRILVTKIDRVRFLGDKGSVIVEQAILSGIGGAATGVLTGAFSAWQIGGDVKGTAIYAGIFFGAAGFLFGFLRAANSTRGSIEFVLGPVKDKREKKKRKNLE